MDFFIALLIRIPTLSAKAFAVHGYLVHPHLRFKPQQLDSISLRGGRDAENLEGTKDPITNFLERSRVSVLVRVVSTKSYYC